ncbi:hypothetical protein N9937_00640 [bacterium]|nr:hypothetical protein [bacterium]
MTTEVKTDKIQKMNEVALVSAQGLKIETTADYEAAGEHLTNLKDLQKYITDEFKDAIDKANKAHKALTAMKKKHLEPVTAAKNLISVKMGSWVAEQQRLEAIEQEKKRKEAQKLEEARQLEEAALHEEAGDKTTAAEVIEETRTAPTPVVETQRTSVAGTTVRTTWSAQVTSLSKLAAHVSQTKDDANLIAPNMPALNARAVSMKQHGKEIVPGVIAVKTTKVV